MMINCPKCNLLQPKDQYCARCGVNMETWQPPRKPKWKTLINNWMVQLTLLFIVIFAVVFWDSLSSKRKSNFDSLPPVTQQQYDSNFEQTNESSFTNSQESSSSDVKQVQGRPVHSQTKKLEALNVQSEQINKSKVTPLQKQAYMRLSLMSRSLIDRMAQKSKRNEGNTMILSQKDFQQMSRDFNNEIRSMGQVRRDFQFAQPQQLFIGEEDRETGLNLGYTLQVNVNDTSLSDSIQAEVRVWSQLQLNGDIGAQASYDINVNTDSVFIVVDPTAHDFEFTQEERSLFDTSQRLRLLNTESFVDEIADIVLVLAIK